MNKRFCIVFAAAMLYFIAMASVYTMAVPRQKGVILATTTQTTTETTTEETTEQTTEEATDKAAEETTVVENSTQATTYSSFSISNTDENGVPYTGKKLDAYNIAANTFKDKWSAIIAPQIVEKTEYSDEIYSVKSKAFEFDDSQFIIKRYNFNVAEEELLTQSIEIPGSSIIIRYVDPETNEWVATANFENTKRQTLFIDTDVAHYMVSTPGVYTNSFENATLEYRPEFEDKINIVKTDTGYSLNFTFPKNPEVIGEIWYLSSEKSLVDWNSAVSFTMLNQDIGLERRFSWDGYYFPTPSNYTPYSETMLYRQPSDYAGASFVKMDNCLAAYDLAYVFIYTCMKNQNDAGYWPTGPKSGWLAEDFSIGANFYDTRFNTDFAESLIYAYKKYNNDEFLFAATMYCEYFIEHANTNNYTTKNGGILVQDYGYDYDHIATHVSLNHQLAELNYLYKIYQITRETKYKDLADKMLTAIEDTQNQWVLANNNLNYALYYLAGTNTMVDYPYLTYNDLLVTKSLYKSIYGKENTTLEYLIKCKKQWMDENNVTGYNE